MSTKPYNLQSYVLASAVVKELPSALEMLKDCKKKLTYYKKYKVVAILLKDTNAAIKELENQLKYYKELKENNGNKR